MRIFLLVLLLAASVGCRRVSRIPEDFDYGTIANGIYKNNFFGFDIPVPANWTVQSKEQNQQNQRRGEEVAAGDNTVLKAKLRAADIQTAILLSVFRDQPGTESNKFNPSFIILAENLGISGVKEAKEYLTRAKEIMKQSNVAYQFRPDYYSEKIGNRKFDAMDASLESNADNVRQTYYSIIDHNFALSFIISYSTEAQKTELKGMINKIRFK